MSQATFETQISPEGTITLHVPAGFAKANQRVRVTVQIQEMSADEIAARRTRFEALYGSIPDLEYVRGSEGPPREIESIE